MSRAKGPAPAGPCRKRGPSSRGGSSDPGCQPGAESWRFSRERAGRARKSEGGRAAVGDAEPVHAGGVPEQGRAEADGEGEAGGGQAQRLAGVVRRGLGLAADRAEQPGVAALGHPGGGGGPLAQHLDELRAVVGNQVAVDAYQAGKLPFPDGTIRVKRAWKRKQSPEFASATIPGAATTIQRMVKDFRKYASTGGWGFGRFVNGKPVDEAQHRTCFACHEARAKGHDYVFTRLAP